MNKRTFRLVSHTARERAVQCVWEAPDEFMVVVQEPTRNLEQNAASWVYLGAFEKQLKWPVNGELVHMEGEEWKDVLSAGFWNETVRLAEGLNGQKVMLGKRTSEFTKKQFSEWIEYLKWFAADRNVKI